MNPLRTLIDAGLHLRADGERLIVAPASALTDELRVLIRLHKVELLHEVRDAERVTFDLIASINRCCDARGDTDRNRAALIEEAGTFNLDHQRDLIEHFDGETASWCHAGPEPPETSIGVNNAPITGRR